MSEQATNPRENLQELIQEFSTRDPERLKQSFATAHPADTADVLEALPPEERQLAWSCVPAEQISEILLQVPEGVRDGLIAQTEPQALVEAVLRADTDDVADLLPALADEVVSEILFTMDREARERLDAVLSYPEDTAGGLMDGHTVSVRRDITLETALRYLRRREELPEYTNRLFVVDRQNRLVGTLLLTKLLTSDPSMRVRDAMDADPVRIDSLTPDSEVAAIFERYDLVTAAVVDNEGHLLGRITIDDVVDVMRDQAGHEVMARAGLSEEEDIFAPVGRSARGRAVWLGVNLVTAFIAAWVIGKFEATIEQLVALAVLMPVVASMGGNAGSQTLTLVIRGLSQGTITAGNSRQVLRHELAVGGLNGLLWAIVVAVVAILWYGNWWLGLIIALAMVINLGFAALAGVALPIVFRKLGIDPALAGGVALTTVTDVVGFLAFLGLAAIFLV
ncbi:MAG: magnesium transporter [Gammaproteobacteria bacterium]|nr:magnesium transporter [Gammaproteobacteria bacterium]